MTVGLLASVAVFLLPAVVQTQNGASKHDLRGRPALEVNANIRVHKVMGEIGTFMLGEFAPGFKSAPHHHTHDQINVGISSVKRTGILGDLISWEDGVYGTSKSVFAGGA